MLLNHILSIKAVSISLIYLVPNYTYRFVHVTKLVMIIIKSTMLQTLPKAFSPRFLFCMKNTNIFRILITPAITIIY